MALNEFNIHVIPDGQRPSRNPDPFRSYEFLEFTLRVDSRFSAEGRIRPIAGGRGNDNISFILFN